jgi:hypothetical protein
MKSQLPAIIGAAVVFTLNATVVAQDSRRGPSEEVRAALREVAPPYAAPVAEPATESAVEGIGSPADDEVVHLPEMTVLERTQQRLQREDLFKRGHFDRELVKEFLSDFDSQFLNRFTIPFIGISKEARAREAYLEQRNREFRERVGHLADAVEERSAQDAKELREALNSLR